VAGAVFVAVACGAGLAAWVTFFVCPVEAAIAGAAPDTISAAIAAAAISLVLVNIKASLAPFPCTPLRKNPGDAYKKIAGGVTRYKQRKEMSRHNAVTVVDAS
jgi:hypothetical protein